MHGWATRAQRRGPCTGMEDTGEILRARDIEALLSGDLKDLSRPAQMRALLERVAASLRSSEAESRQLHTDVSRIAATRKADMAPLAAAVNALSALSADEQAQVLDAWAMGLVDALHAEQAEARQHTLAAMSALARARLAVATIVDHEDTPQHVRLAAVAALEAMPDLTVPVSLEWDPQDRASTGFTVPSREAHGHAQTGSHDLDDLFQDMEPVDSELDELFGDAGEEEQVGSMAYQAAVDAHSGSDWTVAVDDLFTSSPAPSAGEASAGPHADPVKSHQARDEVSSARSGFILEGLLIDQADEDYQAEHTEVLVSGEPVSRASTEGAHDAAGPGFEPSPEHVAEQETMREETMDIEQSEVHETGDSSTTSSSPVDSKQLADTTGDAAREPAVREVSDKADPPVTSPARSVDDLLARLEAARRGLQR